MLPPRIILSFKSFTSRLSRVLLASLSTFSSIPHLCGTSLLLPSLYRNQGRHKVAMVSPSKKRVQRFRRAAKWTSGVSWACCLFTIILIIIINSAGISVNGKNINGESYALLSVGLTSPRSEKINSLTLSLSSQRLTRSSRRRSHWHTRIICFPTEYAPSRPTSSTLR